MCLTMFDPASSWFEIEVVELPVTTDVVIPLDTKGQRVLRNILTNIIKTWFSNYLSCQYIIYDNGSELKLHFEALC